jgi:hypothetical protein
VSTRAEEPPVCPELSGSPDSGVAEGEEPDTPGSEDVPDLEELSGLVVEEPEGEGFVRDVPLDPDAADEPDDWE